jgi:hypothetical protein
MGRRKPSTGWACTVINARRVSTPILQPLSNEVLEIDAKTLATKRRTSTLLSNVSVIDALHEQAPFISADELAEALALAGVDPLNDSFGLGRWLGGAARELRRVFSFEWGNPQSKQLIPDRLVFSDNSADVHSCLNGWKRSGVYAGWTKSCLDRIRLDSKPEYEFALLLDNIPNVISWVRNDPKVLTLPLLDGGYSPDFIIELESKVLVIEVKGRHLLSEWEAGIGRIKSLESWCTAVSTVSTKPWIFALYPEDQLSKIMDAASG